MTATPIRIIGIGNEWRGDDGFGPKVIASLHKAPIAGVDAFSVCDGLALLDAWHDAERVYVVDACCDGAGIGQVLRIDALRQPLPAIRRHSTHAFGVAEAIELGRNLRQLPRALTLIVARGERFGLGNELSEAVQTAVERVVAMLRAECAPASAQQH